MIFLYLSRPRKTTTIVVMSPLSVKVLVNNVFLKRNVVQLRTQGFHMLTFAHITLEHLKLVRYTLHSITESAKKLEVHFCFLQDLDKFLVRHKIKDCVFHRFDLIIWPLARDKLKVHQVRVLVLSNFHGIHHELLSLNVGTPTGESQSASLENNHIVVVVEVLNNLFRMTDPHLYFFSQIVKCLADKRLKEVYILKYIFIGLFEVVPFHVHRQISNKFPFFLVVKIFPQTSRLLNIVTYLPRQLLRKLVFIIELSKYLRTLTSFCVFGSNLLNNTSNAVNVIGKSHTTKGLNKHQTNSLFEIVSHDVSKTNS